MQAGQRVRDYIFQKKIGEGGMGEVWKARHTSLKRDVAIKIMARHLEEDPEFSRRFLQEAQAQARLSHPHIVGVSDFFEEGGRHFLVMPLHGERTLEKRLEERRGPLPVEEALTIARDMLGALDHGHQKGVIHRDVKPANILLDDEGRASLTDFGIALSLGGPRLTATGRSLGTPDYMSPEQIRAPSTVNHLSDVYSAACVIYEMLTGRPPFADVAQGEDAEFAIKEAHVRRPPEPLRRRNPRVPAWLDAAVLRALAKNPNERFSGCGQFRRALDAPPPPPPPPSDRPVTKKAGPVPQGSGKAMLWGFFGAGLGAVALFGLFVANDRFLRQEEAEVEESTTVVMEEPMGTDLGATEPLGTDMGYGVPMGTDMGTTEPMGTEMTQPPDEEPGEASSSLSGSLADGSRVDHDVWLEPGFTYLFSGSCGISCSDLDLSLSPPAGGGSGVNDFSVGNLPKLSYVPEVAGHFRLSVSMPGCSANSCYWTVRITRSPLKGP